MRIEPFQFDSASLHLTGGLSPYGNMKRRICESKLSRSAFSYFRTARCLFHEVHRVDGLAVFLDLEIEIRAFYTVVFCWLA